MLKKIVLLLGFCILFPISVLAHKALFFAYLDEQQIICEGSFSGGRVCKDCAVTVYDAASNQLVVQGKTDSTGKCRFPLSQAILQAQSGLNLFLDGGAGHRAKWFLEPDEYLDFVPKKETSTPSAVAKVDQNHLLSINNEEKNSVNGETIRCIVAEEVARVLDKKLAATSP